MIVNSNDKKGNESDIKICKYCHKEIPRDASICFHCGSKLAWKTRISISNTITLLAMCATVAATWVLVCSYIQTGEGLVLQRESLERIDSSLVISHEQNKLQEMAIGRVDSSLILTIRQLEIQQKANELTQSALFLEHSKTLQERDEFFEMNKPIISLLGTDCFLSKDSLEVVLNISNSGASTADALEISALVFDSNSKYFIKLFSFASEPLVKNKVKPGKIKFEKVDEFAIMILTKWSWAKFSLDYEEIFFRKGHIAKSGDGCSCSTII